MILDKQNDNHYFFLKEFPETHKLKLPQRKSVEDVEKSKTIEAKLSSHTQGNSNGVAIS